MTRGWLAFPFSFKKQSRYYRRISWASATFAFYTDVAMGSLGGKLKTKEHLTGRFADVMSYLYLASAVLRKYESDGEKAQDWPVVHYTLEYIFGEIEIAFQGIYANFPVPLLGALLKGPVRLWSRLNPLANPVTDEETASLMGMIHSNPAVLSRLTSGTFVSHDPNDSLNLIERAAQMKREIEPLLRTIKHAKSSVQLTAEDQLLLDHFQAIKKRVLRVDEFLESEYHHHQKVEKAPIHHQASA
jgi:acyl-CoA dehydrogenase